MGPAVSPTTARRTIGILSASDPRSHRAAPTENHRASRYWKLDRIPSIVYLDVQAATCKHARIDCTSQRLRSEGPEHEARRPDYSPEEPWQSHIRVQQYLHKPGCLQSGTINERA